MTDTTPLPDWTMEAISAPAMRIWCDLLRDDNPIHLDPAAAQSLGFGPRTVNPGPANLAYLINMIMHAVPQHDIAHIDALFLGHALAGDAVFASGATVPDLPLVYDAQLAREGTPLVTARITLRGEAA